jgi:two-component system, chemotaxis family, CheB/CheR fusion protein
VITPHNPSLVVVGIGASAGGLQAYTELLESLPPNTGMAFVIVQHLAAEHESLLAMLLSRATPMPVGEVHDEPHVAPNCIYVIPPNRSMLIRDGKLVLMERAPGVHHAVDIFLSALAESHGHRAIGVVLSGTGNDGTIGIQAIKAAGGITFAQDTTALHAGMPQNAINSGCVDFVLPARKIALEIAGLSSAVPSPFDPVPDSAGSIENILQMLRRNLDADFSQYKVNTLHRRVRRRMALQRIDSVEEYKALLTDNPREMEALYQDILISVTNFFRNPESFDALKSAILPGIFEHPRVEGAVRIWALGCSTGEEVYSLAMVLQEYMEETSQLVRLTVFGTDLNNLAIERARRAWYPKSITQDVSKARLDRFFTEADGGYCVNTAIREQCIFARHNALIDPPFSNMDLVSCRNMLIYLQSGLQRKLLPLLHYALKPDGILFLGPSETISHYRDLFELRDGRHKFYAKRPVQKRIDMSVPIVAGNAAATGHVKRKAGVTTRESPLDSQREAERVLLKHFAPAGVLIDADAEILQFRGDTEPYLTLSEGKPTLNVLKMAREGLLAPLRTALQHAHRIEGSARIDDVAIKSNNGMLTIALIVIPVPHAPSALRTYWILFEPSQDAAAKRGSRSRPRAAKKAKPNESQRQIHVLTQELAATREYLQSTIESQEATNEELQSANEEVQSANEELQSTNEELETSKEEIQSSNEELTTVNEELRTRNDELDRANNDLNNVFSSVQMAVVILGRDLRIRRFTPLAQRAFNILPSDVGRPIGDINLKLAVDDFPRTLTAAIKEGIAQESEVQSDDGRRYLLRVCPYRTQAQKIDGATVVLIDIDTLAQTQDSLRRRVAELAVADRHRNEFLAILAHELRNPLAPLRNAAQILRLSPADAGVSEKARELIERQVKHMSRLVGDLLDAARAQHGQIQLQREALDLRAVVEHAIEMMRPQFDARRQTLRVQLPEAPVVVDGDAARLEQVVGNILNNANKYTGENGCIDVTVDGSTQKTEQPGAVIRIRDNGEGIDSELLPRLFDLFTQADRSLAHSQGGLGIGLSLVRTLVGLHGGSISAHSEGHGCGSEFTIRIPLSKNVHVPVDEGAEPIAHDPGSPTRAQRVLVVDDSLDIRESTAMMLSLAGYETQVAASGAEALQMAVSFRPTAILLDIGLPDLSGYEVVRRLRESDDFAVTRIIAISGYDTPEARDRATEAGFDHHLSKPVPLKDLEKLLSA